MRLAPITQLDSAHAPRAPFHETLAVLVLLVRFIPVVAVDFLPPLGVVDVPAEDAVGEQFLVTQVLLVEADVYQYSGWQSIWQLGTTRAGQFRVVSDVFAAILTMVRLPFL